MHCATGGLIVAGVALLWMTAVFGRLSEFPGPEPTARPLSHRPHRFSRASVYATDCVLTPRLRCSSIYESSSPHRCPPKRQRQRPHARRNVIEITSMTSNMTSSEAGLSAELNCCSENRFCFGLEADSIRNIYLIGHCVSILDRPTIP